MDTGDWADFNFLQDGVFPDWQSFHEVACTLVLILNYLAVINRIMSQRGRNSC